jgi:hypothetical protein
MKPGSWTRTGVAVGIGVLAVGALASVGAAVSPSGTPAAAAQYQPHKVMLCHHTHSKKHPFVTIIVSKSALPAHMRHGDTIGACPAVAAPEQASTKHASKGKNGAHTQKVKTAVRAEKSAGAGRSSSAPGRSGTAPGHATSPPHGGTPPGHATRPAPGATPPTEVASPPSPSSSSPSHGASPPHGGTPPGHGGTPPGQGGTSPGHSGTPPGQGGTPPGQAAAPPGKGK